MASKKGVVQLCGLGANPPEETTLEALRVLEQCAVVFTDVPEASLRRWLKPYCAKLVVLDPKEPVAAQARRVLAAVKPGHEAALAVWGHPLFSSPLSAELLRQAGRAGIAAGFPGAVSPVGSAFARAGAFFGGEYGYPGVQAYEAAAAVREAAALETALPLVAYSSSGDGASWAALAARLAKLFPAGHACRYFPVGGAALPPVAVEKLGPVLKAAPRGVLYVPPLTPVRIPHDGVAPLEPARR